MIKLDPDPTFTRWTPQQALTFKLLEPALKQANITCTVSSNMPSDSWIRIEDHTADKLCYVKLSNDRLIISRTVNVILSRHSVFPLTPQLDTDKVIVRLLNLFYNTSEH